MLAALVLWCYGAFLSGRVQNACRSVSVRWLDGGVSPSMLKKQEEFLLKDGAKDVPEVTLWEETPHQELEGEYERIVTGTVITLFGNLEDVYGEGACLGGAPIQGDVKGCVISEQTAFEIWGSRDVLGKTIYWGQKVYYVYGVVKGKDHLLMVQADESDAHAFPNMQLRFPDGGYREDAETYLKKTGFSKEGMEQIQILDAPLLSWFLSFFSFLPTVLLGMGMMIRVLRQALRLRKNPRLLAVYAPIAVCLSGVLFIIMGNGMEGVPARLIPTGWSNFEFIGNLMEECAKHVKDWLAFPTGRDVTLCLTVFGAILTILVAVVFLIASVRRVRIRSPFVCYGCCLFFLSVCFLMSMALSSRGGLKLYAGTWWTPCLWVMMDYGFELGRRRILIGINTSADDGAGLRQMDGEGYYG